MNKEWQRTSINEVCDITSSKRIYRADYQSEGVPFYRGKEIIEKQRGSLDVSTELFISEEKLEAIEKKFGAPQTGDLLLTSVGTLGVPYVVQRGERFYFKDGNLTWFRNLRNIDVHFLYYWLLSPAGQAQLGRSTIGSSQPALIIVLLKQMEIEIPPFLTQRKIASILSAYDDLIENNLRRIKILEEMAQMIYREWFVHFRFPGHEKIEMVDSPLGKIPEGWEVLVAPECLVINPSIRVDKNTIKPFVNMGGLSDNSMIVEQTDIRKGSNGSKFQKGDTLFARITPCLENGKTGFVQFLCDKEVGLGSTEFIVLRSINLSPEFVYLLARTEDFRNNAIKSMSGASGRQRVRNECFDKYLLAKPENDIIDKFTNTVKPMFEKIYKLSLKNKNLRKTRDLLLPKLISGGIEV